MWPFSKKISAPNISVKDQVLEAIKSLSLPESQPRWSLYAKGQKWDTTTAIEGGFNASAIVYAAVEKRAKLLAAIPWYAGKEMSDGTVERLPATHPLNRLIKKPNRDQSWYEVMYSLSQMMDLSGNGFISEIKGGVNQEPIEIWLLNSQYMKAKPGTERLVDMFEYSNSTRARKIEPDDMVHLKFPNPLDPIFGQPILLSGSRATDIDRESADWQKSSLQNRGVLDIHLSLPENTTQEQVNSAADALKKRQAGPKNARTPIASNGKIEQLGQTAVEMDFVNSRKSVWTEIAAIFGTPLASLGFTEDVNLANADAMNRQLYLDTIIPLATLYKCQFDRSLASEFGDDVVMMYDISNISALQDSFDSKLLNAEKLFKMGYPANIINDKLEMKMPDIKGGDIGYIPTGLIPAGMDSYIDDEIDNIENDKKSIDLIKRLTYGK